MRLGFLASISADRLRAELLHEFSDAERAATEALGGWDALIKTLAERMADQQGHQAQATSDLLHRDPADWRVVFVGLASMSPDEIVAPGGSIGRYAEQAGAAWRGRAWAQWPRAVSLNPVPEAHRTRTPSIGILRCWSAGACSR